MLKSAICKRKLKANFKDAKKILKKHTKQGIFILFKKRTMQTRVTVSIVP